MRVQVHAPGDVCRHCHPGPWDAARREAIRRRVARRRARKLAVASEPYTLPEIAKRDRYRCGICRKRVAMTRSWPHPKAPTIDHVVPLACGGDDTRANVQLAHFGCNTGKRDRGGGEQLRLIG
jgi:5-methylcytosine-specific restriction endonuclease McrA